MKAELREGFQADDDRFVRLYVDEDVYHAVTDWLEGAGFNVTFTVFSSGSVEMNVRSGK